MTVSLGMPETPPRPLAARRESRQIDVGGVLVGGDAPVSVQSMTTTPTADINATLQQIAELTASGCQIVRVAVPDPGRRRRAARDREEVADPGDRRHPLPAEVRLRRDRRRLRGGAGQPGQHQEVRRQGRRDRPGRRRRRRPDPDRRQRRLARQAAAGEVRQGHARRRWSSRRCGSARCSRSTTSATSRSRSSTTTRSSWSTPTGCSPQQCDYPLHLGVTEAGPAFQGTIKSVGRLRRAAGRGHRRHDPGLAVRAAGRGGQGRQPDPRVARPAGSAAWRSSPARPAAAPRSTSTRWPTRSPPASRA